MARSVFQRAMPAATRSVALLSVLVVASGGCRKVPLKWFMLIFRMATSKTGVSINEMARELEISDYKTVWTMAHKVRKAMADRDNQYRLAGLIEMDESFFGPPSSGKRGRGAGKKELVIVAVSIWRDKEGKERPGFAHAFVVEKANAEAIENVLKRLDVETEEIKPLIVQSVPMVGGVIRP